VNVLYRKKLLTQISAFFNPRFVAQVMREESSSTQMPMILLTLNGLASSALGLYLFLNHTGYIEPYSWDTYFLILLGCVGLLIGFWLLSLLVQFYVNAEAGFTEYRYGILLFFQVVGIIVLPLSLIGAYSSFGNIYATWCGIFIMLIAYLLRLGRSLFIGIEHRVSGVFIILYLCTLEILPLVVVYGMLSGEKLEIN